MKCGISSPWLALSVLLLAPLGAIPASSAPMTVFFDGPFLNGVHEGLDAPPPGVPVLDLDTFTVDGSLDVVSQSADGTNIGTGTPPNQITSQWVVENLFGTFPGQVYLLFATLVNDPDAPIPTTYNTNFTDEADEMHDRAGLVIDPATGWVVVETATPFYYVGVPLDFDDAGASCGGVVLVANQACVDVTYFLEDPSAQVFPGTPNDLLVLPELQILMAVVPEPGSGLLVALGLVGLAAKRRHR